MHSKRLARVVENGSGESEVEIGGILSALILVGILAGLTALGTVGVLVTRANASEADVVEIKSTVERQGRNVMRLDECQRRQQQQMAHANAKLDALLTKLEVTKRIPLPALPPSSLEPEPAR
jgi:hypothetical protein